MKDEKDPKDTGLFRTVDVCATIHRHIEHRLTRVEILIWLALAGIAALLGIRLGVIPG